ncbi:HAD family hydrolase [Saccharopolyspora shandongensis]|uniref:HAD family hydrolase n=1 Tax=Saccharopolyspora shandongensis TaxID=418495 RepID=UPI0034079AAD
MTRFAEIDHIVWDWNGTLFADTAALIDATIDIFARAGLPAVTRARYQEHHTQPIPLFYDRLAERDLSDEEQQWLAEAFQETYVHYRQNLGLHPQARDVLRQCADAGFAQSLLSMYPHEKLLPLVETAEITAFFRRIDGLRTDEAAKKAPHLRRHLAEIGARPESVLLVGDSVDDALAARECGAHCVLYHAGRDALHSREHFEALDVPIAENLHDAVTALLSRRQPDQDTGRPTWTTTTP